MHTDERCISAIHVLGNNIMCMHDVTTFKATQFSPLLNGLQKKFPGDHWRDTEPGCQAICENFANSVIKGTHLLRGHEFVLWVCSKLLLNMGVKVPRHNLQPSRHFVCKERYLGGFPSCSSVRLYKSLICWSCNRSIRC
jgi:hypothetical protein